MAAVAIIPNNRKQTMTVPPAGRPIKLLFVQTQALPAGAQEISRLLGDAFAASLSDGRPQFDVHHLFFYRDSDAYDGMDKVHICLERAPKNPFAFAGFLFGLVRRMREIRPDVVLTFQHYGNIFGAPAARLAGVRRIIANHVSAPATIGRATRSIDRMLGLAGFYDVITVNSHQTFKDYQSYPARYTSRIVHVPHGFQDKTVAIGKKEAREHLGLPAGVPLLGCVARLHPLKRLDANIRVVATRPDLHAAFVGQGPDEPRLRDLAAELGVADRVHFVGELPPTGIGIFLAALDVFAFPSVAETFGLAAVEAGQAGVPLVVNDIAVLREVLEIEGEACALFADAGDVDDYAAKIAAIIDDPHEAARLSALGRRLSDRYSLAAMVEAYRKLILGRDI